MSTMKAPKRSFPAKTLSVSSSGELGWIILNRPRNLNALNALLMTELIEATKWFNNQLNLKAVIISGSGRCFSAGADMNERKTTKPSDLVKIRENTDLGRRMAEAIADLRAVSIAQIHGVCVGGAVVIAASCDFRICSSDTKFSIPELRLGIPLTWGSLPMLVALIGPARTKELVMTCRVFLANEAYKIGFVEKVVEPKSLPNEVQRFVKEIVQFSPLTLQYTKRQVDAIVRGGTRAWTWAEADFLLAGNRDGPSRNVAIQYVKDLQQRRKDKVNKKINLESKITTSQSRL